MKTRAARKVRAWLRLCAIAVLLFAVGFLPSLLSGGSYCFVKRWPEVPQGWGLSRPEGIALDSSGNIFVADTGNHVIKKFDSSGRLLAQWGSPGSADGQFGYPWDSRGSGDGEFNYPRAIALDRYGNVFVAHNGEHTIQKLDPLGKFLAKWGPTGSDDGQFGRRPFEGPLGIAVGPSGSVYVADTYNNRVQKFDSSGKFLMKWGSVGAGDGQFFWPRGIAVDSKGNVFVAEIRNPRVQKFDSSGKFLTKWALKGSKEQSAGMFNGSVAVDSRGNVFVADMGIHKFDSSGKFLTRWGSFGTGDGEFKLLPGDIAVDSSGNVFVADTGNSRIQKFRWRPLKWQFPVEL